MRKAIEAEAVKFVEDVAADPEQVKLDAYLRAEGTDIVELMAKTMGVTRAWMRKYLRAHAEWVEQKIVAKAFEMGLSPETMPMAERVALLAKARASLTEAETGFDVFDRYLETQLRLPN